MLALSFLLTAAFANEPAPAPGKMLLDQASADELASLDEVDSGEAARIVELRAQRRGLNSVEELRILGLDDATLDSLRRSTSVEVGVNIEMATRKKYGSADEVLQEFAGEPSVQEVQRWASDYAKISPRTVDRWLRQSRSFAALPQLTLEYRLRDGWDQDFKYYAADGAFDAEDEAIFPLLDDAATDQDAYYTVRARWDLDQLIMSSERIRVINEAQDIVKLRDKVLSEVTRLYFERRRVQVERLLSPKSDTLGQVKQELRLAELTANLDALTGGQFSQATRGSGAGSSADDGGSGGGTGEGIDL